MVLHSCFRGKKVKPTKQNKRGQAWSYTVSSGERKKSPQNRIKEDKHGLTVASRERKKSPQNRIKEDKHGLTQLFQGKGRKAHKTESKRTSMVLHSFFRGKEEKPTKQNQRGQAWSYTVASRERKKSPQNRMKRENVQ